MRFSRQEYLRDGIIVKIQTKENLERTLFESFRNNCIINRGWIKKMWHVYTMDYYSALKRNNIGSFVEMRIDLEPVIQSEVRKRKTDIVY